jgi:hypothetical protein
LRSHGRQARKLEGTGEEGSWRRLLIYQRIAGLKRSETLPDGAVEAAGCGFVDWASRLVNVLPCFSFGVWGTYTRWWGSCSGSALDRSFRSLRGVQTF